MRNRQMIAHWVLKKSEPDGTTTKLNEPGASLDNDKIAAVERALIEAVRGGDGADGAEGADAASAAGAAVAAGASAAGAGSVIDAEEDADAAEAGAWADSAPAVRDWAVLSGSLPPGAPVDWYARLVVRLRGAAPGLRIAVDTSDAPLAARPAASSARPCRSGHRRRRPTCRRAWRRRAARRSR